MRSTFFGKRFFGAAVLTAFLACWTLLALATSQEPTNTNAVNTQEAIKPKEKKMASPADELQNPFEVYSVNGVCDVVLEAVVRIQPFPAAGAKYKLRSPAYVLKEANGKKYNDDASGLVGPTLRVKRGDLLRIRIKNELSSPPLPVDIKDPPENYPQEFSITNLHTHGLHVSPSGKADNIYANILPGGHRQYEYRIPQNHPPGTFWYHPHRHGSVAMQLTGGMAGALIVEGDHEVLFKGKKKAADKVFVLQQIHGYAPPIGDGNLIVNVPEIIYDKSKNAAAANSATPGSQKSIRTLRGERTERTAREKKPKVGGNADPCPDDSPIAPATTVFDQKDGTAGAANLPAWLLVNGQNPQCRTFSMYRGEIQRWRFVHAGVDEVINIAIKQKDKKGNLVTDKDGNPKLVPYSVISVDGIPRGRAVSTYQTYLYPAYRIDVLFTYPLDITDGYTLELWNETTPGANSLGGAATIAQRIAKIQLADGKNNLVWPDDEAFAQTVPLGFRGGITDSEVDNRRWSLLFNFADDQPSRFPINGHEYMMDRIDRHVRLDTAEEWLLKSDLPGTNNHAGHPFHIHVNPFLHYYYEVARSLKGLTPTSGASIKRRTLLTNLGFKVGQTVTFTGKLPSGAPFISNTPVTEKTTLGKLASNLLEGLNAKMVDAYQINFVENGLVLRSFLGKLDGLTIDQTCTSDSKTLCFAPPARQVVDLIWRDTLMAPSTGPAEVVRMRFRDFTGDTVLHCHIVDHEDQGMMKNIRILPAGDPGPNPKDKPKEVLKKASAPAPALKLPDAAKKMCDLADFRGRNVVLVFFQGAECSHCVQELRELVNEARGAVGSDTEIVAVSSRKIDDEGRAFKVLGVAPPDRFHLLVDEGHSGFRAFGCYDSGPMHGLFLIDQKGVVRAGYTGESPFSDAREVVRRARKLSATGFQ